MSITTKKRYHLKGLLFCAILLTQACQDKMPAPAAETRSLENRQIEVIRPVTVDGMQTYFQQLDYHWDNLDKGIPPFILAQFPADFDTNLGADQRKKFFFMGLLPMVLLANESIEQERRTLLAMLDRFKQEHVLSDEDRKWLKQLTRSYGLHGDPLSDQRTQDLLLRRVDTIPPALALAQAANESAWGMSRFARQGNNLFGQWTFQPGTGIVPKNRPPGAIYEVQRFKNLYASIRGYLRNLNTHSAYQGLRLTREKLRRAGQPVTGRALARNLTRYSSRGSEYVNEIRAMISQNRLSDLNQLALDFGRSHGDDREGQMQAGLLTSRDYISRN